MLDLCSEATLALEGGVITGDVLKGWRDIKSALVNYIAGPDPSLRTEEVPNQAGLETLSSAGKGTLTGDAENDKAMTHTERSKAVDRHSTDSLEATSMAVKAASEAATEVAIADGQDVAITRPL